MKMKLKMIGSTVTVNCVCPSCKFFKVNPSDTLKRSCIHNTTVPPGECCEKYEPSDFFKDRYERFE